MDNALLTAGAACIIGAIVGGGLKAFGLELPVLHSRRDSTGPGAGAQRASAAR